MNKVITSVAIISMAVATQAASVSWNSDAIYVPTDKNGTYSTDTKTSKGTVTGYLFQFVDITNPQGEVIKTAAEIYAAYAADSTKIYSDWKDGTLKADQTTTNNNNQRKVNFTDSRSFAEGDNAYAAILYTYTDATYGDFYVANAAKYEVGLADATVSSLNAYVGGFADGKAQGAAITSWTAAAVPEPTSGLLLLLGVAGLALKRKRA